MFVKHEETTVTFEDGWKAVLRVHFTARDQEALHGLSIRHLKGENDFDASAFLSEARLFLVERMLLRFESPEGEVIEPTRELIEQLEPDRFDAIFERANVDRPLARIAGGASTLPPTTPSSGEASASRPTGSEPS